MAECVRREIKLDYQEECKRTMPKQMPRKESLTNMALGIAGESGEIVDCIKKNIYPGHENVDKIVYEIGDLLWYLANLCTLLDITLEQCMEMNVLKLKKRYPNGFDKERSVNRNDDAY